MYMYICIYVSIYCRPSHVLQIAVLIGWMGIGSRLHSKCGQALNRISQSYV